MVKLGKLMILGATFAQIPLIRAAKALNYYTIVASIEGEYPGFAEGDECCYVDITDNDAVLNEAKKLEIDGIATCCMDTGIEALGYVVEHMGLCGLSFQSAQRAANKLIMKEAFEAAGVNTARYRKISSDADLQKAICDLEFPLIIKAVDLMGSRGIYIVSQASELTAAYNMVMRETRSNYCIVEEFIEGDEFGAQAFIHDGKVLFVLPHGDNTYLSGTNIPIGHYVPLAFSENKVQQICIEVEKAIRAIGLDNCAVNCDLIMKNDEIFLIELTGRVGATCLPELVSIYYDVDYYSAIVEMAMGKNPLSYFSGVTDWRLGVPNASRLLISEKNGRVLALPTLEQDEDIYELQWFVHVGDPVHKFTSSRYRIGQVIVKNPDPEKCFAKIETVVERLQKGIKIEEINNK